MSAKQRQEKIAAGCRIGRLTVCEATAQRKNGYVVWRCACDCGGELLLDTRALQRGAVTDCGCITKMRRGMKDLSGRRFGHLTALYPTPRRSPGRSVIWACRCELCGREIEVTARQLVTGNIRSCGRHARANVDRGLQDGTSIRKLEYYRAQRFPLTKSGRTGVYQDKRSGKWIACMQFQGKTVLYRTFAEKEEAIEARKRADEWVDEYLERYYSEHPEWDRDYYRKKD